MKTLLHIIIAQTPNKDRPQQIRRNVATLATNVFLVILNHILPTALKHSCTVHLERQTPLRKLAGSPIPPVKRNRAIYQHQTKALKNNNHRRL